MSEKRFIIDVEDEFQENAVFFGDEFLCFEDDSESLVSKLNEQQAILSNLKEENKQLKFYKLYEDNKRLQRIITDLKKENDELGVKWRALSQENETLKKEVEDLNNIDLITKLIKENDGLKLRLENVLKELYCKDRKLEELGISIECCDADE